MAMVTSGRQNMNIKLYQIYFDEYTKSKVHPLCIPYDNSLYPGKPLQPCFENHVIKDLFTTNYFTCDYIGVLSWQFEKKCNIRIPDVIRLIDEDQGNHDVYTFFRLSSQRFLWRAAENWHKGINEIADHIFNKMGYSIPVRDISSSIIDRKTNIVYGNHFITRPEIYKKYATEFLIPAMAIMEDVEDKWLQDRLNANSGYKKKTLIERLLAVTGFPHYTLHTFICERLFSTWLSLHGNPYSLKHLA